MKGLTSSIISAFICLILSTCAMAQQQVVVPLSNPGKPGKLTLSVTRGSVTVSSYDGKNVIINYGGDGSDNEPHKVTKNGMHRISSNNGGFQATEDHNHVTISGTSLMHVADFNISVPRNFSLDLSTIMGTIKVNGVSGELDISNVNGDVTVTNAAGVGVINTVNGEIKAVFTSVSPGKPMSFSTVNGDIDVNLPADVKASAKIKAQMGEVYTNFDMKVKQSNKTKVNTGSSGMYKVSVNNWIYGDINGGGPQYQFKTLRGDIYIRKK